MYLKSLIGFSAGGFEVSTSDTSEELAKDGACGINSGRGIISLVVTGFCFLEEKYVTNSKK